MIERIDTCGYKDYSDLLDFLNNNFSYDFYFSQDNAKVYITDKPSLKALLRNTVCAFGKRERGDYKGIIIVWRSIKEGIKKYYVKINACNDKVAEELITILNWNFGKEMFFRIRNNSKLIEVAKRKGFRFFMEKGPYIILKGKSLIYKKEIFVKHEDEE